MRGPVQDEAWEVEEEGERKMKKKEALRGEYVLLKPTKNSAGSRSCGNRGETKSKEVHQGGGVRVKGVDCMSLELVGEST